MSHTHKTEPLFVKVLHRDVRSEEVHDHTRSPCDLPASPRDQVWGYSGRPVTHCYRIFRWSGTSVCSCTMCRSPYAPAGATARRRATRRTDRDRLSSRIAAEWG